MRYPRPHGSLLATIICALLFLLAPVTLALDVGESVRVRLFAESPLHQVEIVAENNALEFFLDNASTPIVELSEGERVLVEARTGEVYAAFQNGGIHALGFRVRALNEGAVRIAVDEAADSARIYPDLIRITVDPERPGELLIVNELDLETYVAAVLDQEFEYSEIEAARAVAIAVRTYALRNHGSFEEAYDQLDSTPSLRYRGVAAVQERSIAAAEETRGEILTYDGRFIDALHFTSSGGHTASNEYVFDSDPRPYLRGKPDPFDQRMADDWQATIDRGELLEVLSDHYELPIQGFLIENRSRDGRARTIALVLPDDQRRYISGAAFRAVVNESLGSNALRSTNFTAVRQGSSYLFEGVGIGHGVGLSHSGAQGMALRGHDYREILSYYYTDVDLTRQDELTLTGPRPAREDLSNAVLEHPPTFDNPSAVHEVEPSVPEGGSTTTVFGTPRAEPTREPLPESNDVSSPAPPRRIGW